MIKFAKALAVFATAAEVAALNIDIEAEDEAKAEEAMILGERNLNTDIEEFLDQMQEDEGLTNAERNALGAGRRWENNEVRYCFDPDIFYTAKRGFQDAFKHYNEKFGTCFKFEELDVEPTTDYKPQGKRQKPEQKYKCKGYPEVPSIFFRSSDQGCYAHLGQLAAYTRKNLVQLANIGSNCEKVGVCIHEIGHSLGMGHEHQRPDQKDHIKVMFDNLRDGWARWFQPMKGFDAKPYCYESVMHYGAYSPVNINPRKPSMVPINCDQSWEGLNRGVKTCPEKLGQREGLADCDTEQLNIMYNCNGNGPKPPTTDCSAKKDKYPLCPNFKAYCSHAGHGDKMKEWCQKSCCSQD